LWCKDYVMTAKQDAVINELNTKVERLIKLYISSLDKNREMDSEMKELRIQIERMKSENMKLHEEIKTLKVVAAISTGEGSSEAKNRISQLVREIDKCIALLNN
jgi:predicted nuclease with TOPRIM domain